MKKSENQTNLINCSDHGSRYGTLASRSIALKIVVPWRRAMDFSSHNPRSSNALNLAARTNDVSNVRRLLKKINPNCVDNRGWTCLHEAASNDNLDCLQIILKRRSCRPLVESHEGHTALYVACQNNSMRCIEYLLKNVDDIANYGSREGFTPLHLVSRQGRADSLQLLIEHGAIIDVVDFDGDTPLHEACMGRQPEIVNILLHAGACPEIQNDREATPLHIACSSGCLESVKYLHPFITDINVLDSNKVSPLMAACHGENEDVIQFLLEHGANPDIENIRGKMALDLALERDLIRGFKLLFHATTKDEICLDIVYAALSPSYLHIEIIEMLLASDLEPEYFLFTKSWIIEMEEQTFVSSYKVFAPLSMFLNIAEYIYKMSVEKFDELLYMFLMKGMSVNADQLDEVPPLVWLHYCPHSICFEHVLHLLVQLGCNVDYCSEIFDTSENMDILQLRGVLYTHEYGRHDFMKISGFPDAFYSSLLIDPVTLPLMITYSLQCDPGYVINCAYDLGALERLPTTTMAQLMNMIDKDCDTSSYERFKYQVLPLKHLSRLQVRNLMKSKDETFRTTQQFLDILGNLPLPEPIKQYLRFL